MDKHRHLPFSSLMIVIFIFLLGFCTTFTLAFNIEDRLPIMKMGPKGSLFGLSIAQHHITANSVEADNAVLLVGAPTDERAPAHSVDAVRPGGFYKCDVSEKEDCTRVIITPPENFEEEDFSTRLFPEKVNTMRTNSSNQWLGVTVKSHKPGGKIVVCAHRYTIRGGVRKAIAWEAVIGRCFMLENSVEPLKDRLSFEYTPCQGMLNEDGKYDHLWLGYCQAGTAVNFADVPKPTKTEEYIAIGAPGSFTWSGALYTSQLNPGLFPIGSINMWTQEVPNTKYPIKKNSLLGSSLANGVLLDSDINYIAGAPGVNSTGSVVIFAKVQEVQDEKFVIKEMVHGDRVASRFGHEVQLIDVTGDGRLDLIVGAPQYYDRELKLGGAVYIYVNKGLGQIGPDPTQILFGTVDSSFGMSITNLGDVNMDGADDIAIGAPGADEWKGAVYIYHGNNQDGTKGVHDEPSQIIRASKLIEGGYLANNITGMGYSVSGGLDMDFNGYPDVAAGSLSDSVVMFQSRPIVNIIGTIEGPDIKIELENRDVNKGYDIEVCLRYTASPRTFDESVEATYTVKLDTTRLGTDLPTRASFSLTDTSAAEKSVNITLYKQSRKKKKCETLTVYIKKDIQDKLSPIELELSFTTPNLLPKRQRQRRAANVPTPTPIMNRAIENTAFAEIKFSKACGDDEICNSKLSLTAEYQILVPKGEEDVWKKIKKNSDGIPVLKLGNEKQIGMLIDINNPAPGEDAHQARLYMWLPPVLDYTNIDMIPPIGGDIHCGPIQDNKTDASQLCNLGNPFPANGRMQFRLKLLKENSIYEATGFEIKLQLQTTSQQPGHDIIRDYPVIVHVEAQLDIEGYASREQVKFGGTVIGESAVKEAEDAGSIHSHIYEVTNTGTAPANNVQLHISWPQNINNGKWLFYLLEANVRDGSGNCTLPEEVNPLNLRYVPGSERQKRSAEISDADPGASNTEPVVKEVTKGPESTQEKLICNNTASCIEFSCSLGTLGAKAKVYIDLHAVLWNSTFLEEYKGVSKIEVQSKAMVSIAQENVQFSESSELESVVWTTVNSEVVIPVKEEVNWWIIVAASIAGVVLLVCLVLLLWKCGFFKRKQFGDYQKARRHKQASKKADERETLY
uniref:integrin alpha-6-like isoform X1 n=1 Tax=Styela clava TaxID=7725 RepID=UPI00193AD5C7|nr:integrin alpha-6-like isoform X1 [Styela clava]